MNQKTKWIKFGCSLILLAAAGIVGVFFGKNITEGRLNRKCSELECSQEEANRLRKKLEITERFQEEKNFNILLNRSELDGLGEIKGTIYVTGHKSPDSDTVGSSIAYASLLRSLGYDAIPVLLGKINHESAFIIETAELQTPKLLENAAGLNMILVDHSEYTQSADGLQDANVIGIIDHHADGSVTTKSPLIYDARPLGSTATIIWIRYRNYGLTPDRKVAIAMLGAILSDTKNLKSNTTTYADREAVKALSALGGISDTDAFYQKMYKASISYEGMSDKEILFSDYKEYKIAKKSISVSCINAYDEKSAKKLIKRMKSTMSSTLASTRMDMSFALISILHDDISITYIVPSDDAANKVLESAFGDDKTFFEDTFWKIEPYASRKKVFIPAITKVLESIPKK